MSNNSLPNLRVGISAIGSKNWMAGFSYVELLLRAMATLPRSDRPQIFLVIHEALLDVADFHSPVFPLVDGLVFVGKDDDRAQQVLKQSFRYYPTYQKLFAEIDFYFPIVQENFPGVCSASWIADFQYAHLPDLFSPEEWKKRDALNRRVAEESALIVFSSKDAEKDFRTLFPSSPAATRILSFHYNPPDDVYRVDPVEVQHQYGLPNEFLICCNQFWVHKNHLLLFEAIAKIRQEGTNVHLVCTGTTTNKYMPEYFSQVQQRIEQLGIGDLVHILGVIPRNDQIQLIRRSLAVVQPSLFEGWSTVVEDARAFGKTILLSDLAVNYEQSPDYAVYFNRYDVNDLAGRIRDLLPALRPGPDFQREQEARFKAEKMVRDYVQQFCEIVLTARSLFETRRQANNKGLHHSFAYALLGFLKTGLSRISHRG